MRFAGGRCLAGAGNGCGSFEGREQRPTEQAYLLAGDNYAGAMRKRFQRRGSGRAGCGGVLRSEHADDLRPVRGQRGTGLPAGVRRK